MTAAGGPPRMEAPTIFVQLAAYREPELAATISSCIDGAVHPERLRFGICLQFDEAIADAGSDCLDRLGERAELRVLRYPAGLSRGGCWARFEAQGLYDGEDFTLQVDAHSRMADGWDDALVDLVRGLPGAKPLITGFPPLYRLQDGRMVPIDDVDDPVPVTQIVQWSPDGWIHHPTVPAPPGTPPGPRPTRVISGAFVFTVGAWNVEVRQDPEHLYSGEEFALTLRSFTSGYDLWNPPRRIIWHRMHPEANPKYVNDDPDGLRERRHERACRRLRVLLAGDPEGILDPFSLGAERTLDEYWDYSGIRWPGRTISESARLGIPPERSSAVDTGVGGLGRR
ncbi:MAG: GlcNAc-transferase family protein [Acidimicrobiales bacterium]